MNDIEWMTVVILETAMEKLCKKNFESEPLQWVKSHFHHITKTQWITLDIANHRYIAALWTALCTNCLQKRQTDLFLQQTKIC